jgi:hypothetical protein
MKDAAATLRSLTAFCVLAFLGFAVAGLVDPSDRGPLHASASAFLVGAVLAVVAGRAHAEQTRRLASVERRLSALEDKKGAER